MELKGTKSEKNVLAAFAGESQARNKYTYFALQAKTEGYDDISLMFEKMADNEREHAKLWFKLLNDGLGDVGKNLIASATGENYEWKSMYPEFAAQAREDGFEMLAVMFEKVAAIENDHERRFLETFIQFQNSTPASPKKVVASIAAVAPTTAPTPAVASTSKANYRCMFCGDLESNLLDLCPVCEAIGAFESIEE